MASWLDWFNSAALTRIEQKVDTLMSELQDAVNAIVEQLNKAQTEITTEITNLEASVAAGETPDLTALKAAAQSLDDVVPDNLPTEEPPA